MFYNLGTEILLNWNEIPYLNLLLDIGYLVLLKLFFFGATINGKGMLW